MITANFSYDNKSGSLHMVMSGHSQVCPKGHDIICAGASTLAASLGSAILQMWDHDMLEDCPVLDVKEGFADIVAIPKEAYREAVQLVFWVIENGVGIMANSFPENVTLASVMVVDNDTEEEALA